jgi:hypothetical protein
MMDMASSHPKLMLVLAGYPRLPQMRLGKVAKTRILLFGDTLPLVSRFKN